MGVITSLKKSFVYILACVAWLAAIDFSCYGQGIAQPSVLEKVALSPVIMARRQRDHRIYLQVEGKEQNKSVHVFMTLSDFEAPFSFTLGWFEIVPKKSEEICLDEFGERIPLPGARPERKGFNKADLAELKGFDLMSDGNLKAALKEFELGVNLAPNSAKAHNNLGACLAALGQWGEAQAQLDYALKVKGDYAVALTNRAWLALMLNQPELALKDANDALGFQNECKQALIAKAKAYLHLQKLEDANSLCNAIYKLWPSDPQACILSGDIALEKGNIKAARWSYKKALILSPGNAVLAIKLAQTAEGIGNLDLAIKEAKDAVQMNPDDANAHLMLGKFLEKNQENRQAQIQFEKALEVSSSLQARLLVYGPLLRVLLKVGQENEADKLSKQCVEENKQCAECHYNRAWFLSQLQGRVKKLEAIAEYRQAIGLEANLAQAHYNLALLLIGEGKHDEAQNELKSFISKAPHDPEIALAKEMLVKLSH